MIVDTNDDDIARKQLTEIYLTEACWLLTATSQHGLQYEPFFCYEDKENPYAVSIYVADGTFVKNISFEQAVSMTDIIILRTPHLMF